MNILNSARRKAHSLELFSGLPNTGFVTFTHFPDSVSPPTCRFDQHCGCLPRPSSTNYTSPHHLNSPLWLMSPQRLLMAHSHPQKPAMRMPGAWLPRTKRTLQCFTMPKTSMSSIRSCIRGPYGSLSHQVERLVHPLQICGIVC